MTIQEAIAVLNDVPSFVEATPESLAQFTHWIQSGLDSFLSVSLNEWVDSLLQISSHETKNQSSADERNVFFNENAGNTSYEEVRTILRGDLFRNYPFPPCNNPEFTFIDLFAGIGGFRIGMQDLQGKCVFSCEWDKNAQETYFSNFGEYPFGDVHRFTSPDVSDDEIDRLIPDHDILCAGFPCQPFSRAGVSARNSLGLKSGFECETQGTLFFDIMRIAKVKRPEVLFLENVKGLRSSDGGRTFSTIRKSVEEDLNYSFHYKIINSNTLVPQNRERCYIVCFKNRNVEFEFPSFNGAKKNLGSILEKNVSDEYTISDRLWKGHQERTKRNLNRGTGFTAFLADLSRPSNTLVARYGKDGKECLIPQEGKNPRKLTPRECARLQGFPETFIPAKSKTAAYRQFGNAVSVPVVKRIGEAILKTMR